MGSLITDDRLALLRALLQGAGEAGAARGGRDPAAEPEWLGWLGGLGGLLPDDPRAAPVVSALEEVVARGRAAWPGLPLDPARLARHLGAHLAQAPVPAADEAGDAATVVARLELLHAGDLYLACACTLGVAGAAAAFDRHFGPLVGQWLHGLGLDRGLVDDLRQALAVKMLVAGPSGRPRIADYTGRSPLASWLRVVVARMAIDEKRRRPLLPLESSAAGLPAATSPRAPAASADIRLLRDRHGAEFRRCLQEAVAALPPAQRDLLRLHFVEALSVEAIAQRRQVHRATVFRHVAAARAAVFEHTRRLLSQRLGLREGEFDSLAVVLRSELDLSLTGVLGGD